MPTRPYHGTHVAPFPVDLPLRAIAAGCPPRLFGLGGPVPPYAFVFFQIQEHL